VRELRELRNASWRDVEASVGTGRAVRDIGAVGAVGLRELRDVKLV